MYIIIILFFFFFILICDFFIFSFFVFFFYLPSFFLNYIYIYIFFFFLFLIFLNLFFFYVSNIIKKNFFMLDPISLILASTTVKCVVLPAVVFIFCAGWFYSRPLEISDISIIDQNIITPLVETAVEQSQNIITPLVETAVEQSQNIITPLVETAVEQSQNIITPLVETAVEQNQRPVFKEITRLSHSPKLLFDFSTELFDLLYEDFIDIGDSLKSVIYYLPYSPLKKELIYTFNSYEELRIILNCFRKEYIERNDVDTVQIQFFFEVLANNMVDIKNIMFNPNYQTILQRDSLVRHYFDYISSFSHFFSSTTDFLYVLDSIEEKFPELLKKAPSQDVIETARQALSQYHIETVQQAPSQAVVQNIVAVIHQESLPTLNQQALFIDNSLKQTLNGMDSKFVNKLFEEQCFMDIKPNQIIFREEFNSYQKIIDSEQKFINFEKTIKIKIDLDKVL